jgi:hypothetical protein
MPVARLLLKNGCDARRNLQYRLLHFIGAILNALPGFLNLLIINFVLLKFFREFRETRYFNRFPGFWTYPQIIFPKICVGVTVPITAADLPGSGSISVLSDSSYSNHISYSI